MKAAVICIIGFLSVGSLSAEPYVEGHVRLPSGAPVPGARVLLFDLADLRAAPLAATTDGSGRFTLPLANLSGALPEGFELGANYPNPFNPSTMIPYQLPAAMHVRLEVYNLLGQRVATLVDGEQPAGFHTASWDATDASGEAVGAGVYLYRLSGAGMQVTRSMLLIDGQAGIASGGGGSTGWGGEIGAGEDVEPSAVYGLTVSGPGLVPYVDPAFRVDAGMAPLDLVVGTPRRVPPAKATSSGGILGDVDNTGDVDFFDALLVALYSQDASIVMPNNGDISLGDVNADGRVGLSDAWIIATYLNDPSDPSLPPGIGESVGPAASLSPDPSTVTFADDGAWHRFTVAAREPVSVVVNPAGTTPRLEITTGSGRGNYCPAEAEDDVSRRDGQAVYLAGCGTGPATVELRRRSDGTVLNTYTFEVTGSPADLVVESASVSDRTLTPGQSFTLRATVRNQGTGESAATTLRWYRSSNRTISTQDTQVGTDAVVALGASRTSAESISLTAPSSEGTYYYGACVVSVSGESNTQNNCSTGIRVTVEASSPDLVVESVSVSESSLTTGQSFTLRGTVRNQGPGRSAATTLRWYRSTDATITTRDTQVGTDAVGALAASGTSAESISLTAPSSEGTYYYGACVAGVSNESDTGNNCSRGARVTVETATISVDEYTPVDWIDLTDGGGIEITFETPIVRDNANNLETAHSRFSIEAEAGGGCYRLFNTCRVGSKLSDNQSCAYHDSDGFFLVTGTGCLLGSATRCVDTGALELGIFEAVHRGGYFEILKLPGDPLNTAVIGGSRWQRRDESEWLDVEATVRDGVVCGNLLPDEPGEYRWVVHIEMEGQAGSYASTNTLVIEGSTSSGDDGSACTAGLVMKPGESCSYKNGTFSVNSSGMGIIISGGIVSTSGNNFNQRGNLNGVRWDFVASRNSGSDSWTIQVAD